MILRIRDATGQLHPLASLSPSSTWAETVAAVAALVHLPPERFSLKGGFPPRLVEATPDKRLEEMGICNGDMFLLVVAASSSSSETTTARIEQNTTISSSAAASSAAASSSAAAAMSSPASAISSSLSLQGGILQRRVMADDNSCLFSAVGYLLHHRNRGSAASLRQAVVDFLSSHPQQFSEAMLGRPLEDYCRWIQRPESWGGAVELAIFAELHQTEIVAIDIRSLRANRFGEDRNYGHRCFVIYDGIHYDALVLSPKEGLPENLDTLVFPTSDNAILEAALAVARKAKESGQFTDVANFDVRCAVCQQGLVGEKGVQEHASATGHSQFTEYHASS